MEETVGGPVTPAQAGSLFVYLLFVVLWLYAELVRWRAGDGHKEHQDDTELDVLVDKKQGGVRTPPRSPRTTPQPGGFLQENFFKLIALEHETLQRNRENLRHVVEMGTIILWLYVADRTTIITAGPKEYIRDVFLFIFLVLTIVASSYSTTQGRAPRLINRQQTEEWKGWMQVLFLLYHYYEAREVYNAIRVFIASYVWMTGFGNFAYYWKTRDFSAGRFAQMMWRLNLLAFVCCMALDNQYMLYYICPMHTLYTVMVYGALCLWRGGNDSSFGIWTKFAVCTAIIAGVFEYERVFYTLFRPFNFLLGYTDPRRPNPNTMHEFYFRAGLDRYIWIHGMICGYLHPTFEKWLQAIDEKEPMVRRTIRTVLGAVSIAAMVTWYNTVYTLPKLEYNKLHPFTSWIPITAFLVLRNITPSLRLKSLGLYGWLGCITLETYVLFVVDSPEVVSLILVAVPMITAHRLTKWPVPNSQPIYLLSILPEYPLLNFSVVTLLYIFLAFRLFKSTAWLRDAIIPHDDDGLLRRNLVTLALGVGSAWMVGFAVSVLAHLI